MALRHIRIYGDEILTKACRPVQMMTPRTKILIRDMLDTMYDANGVGLAAPQVGILKQIVVIDIGEEGDGNGNTDADGNSSSPLVLVNPEILETSGEQTGQEGCLSLPGQAGMVTRPNYVKVKAFDENMHERIIEGTELLARAICHECDHLKGIMYVEKVEGDLFEVTDEPEDGGTDGK
ncbi:MAG: peptide deformylase [Lachnospiraceae bacterium]|nr:peptide deformylase [Lachnospiraceae bacterium]